MERRAELVEGIVTDTLAPVVELTLIGEEERQKKSSCKALP